MKDLYVNEEKTDANVPMAAVWLKCYYRFHTVNSNLMGILHSESQLFNSSKEIASGEKMEI